MADDGATLDPRRAREAALRPLGPRGEGWIGFQMLLEIGILVLAPFTGPAWEGPARAVAVVAGLLLLAGGVGAFGWGAAHLGASFSVWVTPRPSARLVTDGPYRFTRHPICTAQVALCLGWALVAASPVAIALVPVVAWYLDRYKLAREEQALLARYPGYAAYMRAVPHRMLPVPPRRLASSGPAGA
jgi:protein-S-isoprenylcysteine O-methyltransferase Ste14